MKKYISIILILSAILSSFFTLSLCAATTEIRLVGGVGAIGKFVDVTVSVSGYEGDKALVITPEYDTSAFVLYDVKDLGLLQGPYHGKNAESGKFQLTWEKGELNKGTVAILTFYVKSGAQVKGYPVTAVCEGGSVVGGTVSVTDSGDATEDGLINKNDVNCILEYLTGQAFANDKDAISGDFNKDAKVNLLDAIFMARSVARWEKSAFAEDRALSECIQDEPVIVKIPE